MAPGREGVEEMSRDTMAGSATDTLSDTFASLQRALAVKEGESMVLASWDLDVPHQTHPQNPIHTSLARFVTV